MKNNSDQKLDWKTFLKVEMRVGTVLAAELYEEAKDPAYKMIIDFGEFGTLKSSAQITELYASNDIIGKQVIAVINFPPKQIANMISECLVLGAVSDNKEVTLIEPERKVKNGTRIA